jgi:aromatic ring hydroxylase
VTYPAPEELDHPLYGAAVRRYLGGANGVDGAERLRVMNLISDLTTGEFGGYQAVLAVHAEGSIEAEKLTILAQYPRERALRFARWLAGLEAQDAM